MAFLISFKVHAQSASQSDQSATAGKDWSAFAASLKGLAPEERIRQVEGWIAGHKQNIEASNLLMKERLAQPLVSTGGSSDTKPEDQLNQAIVSDLNKIRDEKLSPEQRIAKVDELLSQRQSAIENQKKTTALSIRQRNSEIAVSETPSVAVVSTAEKLSAEIHELVSTEAKNLSSEERIAAIDRIIPKVQEIEKQTQIERKSELLKETKNPR